MFVLVRTSNPGGADIQELELADGSRVWERVARLVASLAPVAGAVVGATQPGAVARARELMPAATFLLPGIGAQGGDVATLGPAFAPGPAGGLVSASRSVLYASRDGAGRSPPPPRQRGCARRPGPSWRAHEQPRSPPQARGRGAPDQPLGLGLHRARRAARSGHRDHDDPLEHRRARPHRRRRPLRRRPPPGPVQTLSVPDTTPPPQTTEPPPEPLPVTTAKATTASTAASTATTTTSASTTASTTADDEATTDDGDHDRNGGQRVKWTVKTGDTLSSIATQFQTSVRELERLNPNVDPAALQVGQELFVR